MEGGSKIWIKRFAGLSLVLILIAVAAWSQSTDVLEKMDVNENHILKLEGGEQHSIELSEIGYYIAFRSTENSSLPELKLIDSEGIEIEGREPGLFESNNRRPDSTGKIVYVPVRVFEIPADGEYVLVNEGNTTLWLVDELEIQASLLSDISVVVTIISCCLGFTMAIITLVMGLILLRQKGRAPGTEIIIQQQNIMTTDELFRNYNSDKNYQVPDPFFKMEKELDDSVIEKELEHKDELFSNQKQITEDDKETENNWKNWDEG